MSCGAQATIRLAVAGDASAIAAIYAPVVTSTIISFEEHAPSAEVMRDRIEATLRGYHRVFAGIALPNDASIALHRWVGFDHVGVYHEVGYKLGGWHDVSWSERPLGPPGMAAREPVPLAEMAPDVLRAILTS